MTERKTRKKKVALTAAVCAGVLIFLSITAVFYNAVFESHDAALMVNFLTGLAVGWPAGMVIADVWMD
jgi:hypothetical protein